MDIDINTYLENFYKGTKNPSLNAMKYFMDAYDNFEKTMRFIHIAGTNGKGSCTEIISNILINEGYKVGKFLSPHLVRFNERISINGIDISDKEMSNLVNELEPLIDDYNQKEGVNITLFELETIMALLHFYRNKVDFVVLETGLGGLYDCTNIITKPIVSVITSVGYDHMHILGNTLPEIAYQKAGIIKCNSNTVIFEQEPEVEDVFINECKAKNSNLFIVRESDISNYTYNNDLQSFDYKGMSNLQINLKGKVQIQNACVCIEVIKILDRCGYSVSIDSIRNGLKTVVHRGRMEKLSNNPMIIFDGAHNEPAMKNLQNTIEMYYANYKKVYIVSILKRKNYKRMLSILAEDKNALYVLTSGDGSSKYATSDELYECMVELVDSSRLRKKNLQMAVADAIECDCNTVNFIVGSFYVYGMVVDRIKILLNSAK